MSFLWRVAGINLRDSQRSLDIQERLREEQLLLRVEVVRASGQNASWTFPWGGVSGMPIQKETPGPIEETLERLNLLAGLGTSW